MSHECGEIIAGTVTVYEDHPVKKDTGLVYIGKVIDIQEIEGADFIVCATVVCGMGGKWKGVVRKKEFSVGDPCIVFLPDSVLPPREEFEFMAKNKYRVKMCRFRGAPSEVLIVAMDDFGKSCDIYTGWDITQRMGVTKYHKPIPASLQGKVKGPFPGFIPKTDEPNYQSAQGIEYVDNLRGKPYYITEKADGASTTAYKYKGSFGLCSRNWELERDEENGYWKVAIQHKLEENLPEGYALQWETCGPKIQSNPHGFKDVTGLAFSAYNIEEHRYLHFEEFMSFCELLKFTTVPIVVVGDKFCDKALDTLGEGTYKNGNQREGVVVRSVKNYKTLNKPISFKVINLNYEASK